MIDDDKKRKCLCLQKPQWESCSLLKKKKSITEGALRSCENDLATNSISSKRDEKEADLMLHILK